MIDEPPYETIMRWRSSMRRRLKRRPDVYRFWHPGMGDGENRNCKFCGRLFCPDLSRPCKIPGAPFSVIQYQQRSFCTSICSVGLGYYSTHDDGRDVRTKASRTDPINRSAALERDDWRCYLCGRPTIKGASSGNGRGASIDHIVPISANGTDNSDNIRCACIRCNREKGNRCLWDKLRIYITPEHKTDVLTLLTHTPTLEELVELWRYYIFNEDEEQRSWNKPPHPLVEPIVSVFPHAGPVALVETLTAYDDPDRSGRLILEKEWTDGSKTVERLSLSDFERLKLTFPPRE
jgi:HNH endonuclease